MNFLLHGKQTFLISNDEEKTKNYAFKKVIEKLFRHLLLKGKPTYLKCYAKKMLCTYVFMSEVFDAVVFQQRYLGFFIDKNVFFCLNNSSLVSYISHFSTTTKNTPVSLKRFGWGCAVREDDHPCINLIHLDENSLQPSSLYCFAFGISRNFEFVREISYVEEG